MATAQAHIAALMNSPCSIEEKLRMLAAYFYERCQMALALNSPERQVLAGAMRRLSSAGSNGGHRSRLALPEMVQELVQDSRGQKNEWKCLEWAIKTERHATACRTAIIVCRDTNEHVPVFLGVRRDRLTYEFANGRRWSGPLRFSSGAAEGKTAKLLSCGERTRRVLVRKLAGRHWEIAQAEILLCGMAMLDPLLDELAGALKRLREMRKSILSSMLLASTVGEAGVQTAEQALVRRIPVTIAKLAERMDADKVRQRVQQHTADSVRQVVLRSLDQTAPTSAGQGEDEPVGQADAAGSDGKRQSL